MERKVSVRAKIYYDWSTKNDYGGFANIEINGGIMHINSVKVAKSNEDGSVRLTLPFNKDEAKDKIYKHVELPYKEQNPLYNAFCEAYDSALEQYREKQDCKLSGETVEIEFESLFLNVPSQTGNDVPLSEIPF